MKNIQTRQITYASAFLALALVLPFLTAQIPEIGRALLPMHIPVLLCGFICGSKYGGIVGFIAPLLRSLLFGMPPMYPVALAMSFELAVYGIIAGLLFSLLSKKLINYYISLIIAMFVGRVVWGLTMIILLSFSDTTFTFETFIGAAMLNAIPGILIQFILIPPLVKIYYKYTNA